MNKKMILFLVFLLFALFGSYCYNNFTLFVIQPIGAIPEGRTLLIERKEDMPFIDSADAMCERRVGGVSLLCRGMALGEVGHRVIYARLPYSEWLYLRSTKGAVYSK